MAIKRAWAVITDTAGLGQYHNPAWTDNQLTVPCTYDEATQNYVMQTTAVEMTSWYNTDHVYTVTLYAEDDAGNIGELSSTDTNYGSQLKIRVLEKNLPEIIVDSNKIPDIIGAGDFIIPYTAINIRDGENYVPIDSSNTSNLIPLSDCIPETRHNSGIDPSTFKVYVDGTAITYTDDASLWKVSNVTDEATGEHAGYAHPSAPITLSGLSGGNHTIKLTVSDNDGNEATFEKSILVHTAGPDLVVLDPSQVTTMVGLSIANYTIRLKAKASDAASIDKVEVKYWYGSKDNETPTGTVTIPKADIPAASTEDGYTYVDISVPVYSPSEQNYDSYDSTYYTIVAYDSYGSSSSVNRQLDKDTAPPTIYDVTTEATTVDTNKIIRIKFRLYDSPPQPGVTVNQDPTVVPYSMVPSTSAEIPKYDITYVDPNS